MQSNSDFSKIIPMVVDDLSSATELDQITRIVAAAARTLANADGATFVLREDGKCYYADEDAISPLWKGKRFPQEACISGWCMMHGKVVTIKDIYADQRVPHDAYRPTFVKSLCMVPIRPASPIGAIGNYWSDEYTPSADDIKHLQILANCAGVAIENWELKNALQRKSTEKNILLDKHSELETAIQTLVHDLRNPVASIVGFSDLLQRYLDPKLDDKSRSYFASLNRVTNRFNQTLGQLLSLYKISAQELKKQTTDLSIIGNEIESQLVIQEPQRAVQVSIDEKMIAYADPLLIRHVLENLMSNAFKFTNKIEKPKVHVGCLGVTNKEKTFFVRDNGAGFDAEYVDKLFKPMSRLHSHSEFSGTGLGLASVARIITAHGGNVRAEGRENEGATFYFSLPHNGQVGPKSA